MIHQISAVHYFSPPNEQVTEKSFLCKSCSMCEKLAQKHFKHVNFAQITYI